ncbi:glycosyltransferase family 2 protein [Sporosalibacterium faouarense]|uniref:glycosyltransferase family 2 protein n=1 Tax=Sporosalibacterium faouarense TaxID=516123 RepID=UPI00192CB5A1|nr:glycosyltransferase family 2 protein [Sporosalibacterium faouarense]
MEHKYKLSICMIVKNEEENMQSCLESISPLLEDSFGELIIVDTGSTDATPQIAKRYTDKVYFHEWNNNFSDMRNISLSYATGEWIFIIDGDEELVDCDRLIYLLNSMEIEKYNTISIMTKNYFSTDNDKGFALATGLRVFRNDGEFHYEGSIHNQPKFKNPILGVDIYLDHYGYAADRKEVMEKKFKRTSTILKQELEKDPDNIYYRYQLAVSYDSHQEYDLALNEVRKAYEIAKKKKVLEQGHVYIYGCYSKIAFNNKEYMEAIRICQEGLKILEDSVDLRYILAKSKSEIGEKKASVEAFRDYVEFAEKFDTLEVSKNPSLVTLYASSKHIDFAYMNIGKDYLIKEKYLEAYKTIKKIQNHKTKSILMIEPLIKLKKFSELKFYYKLIKNEDKQLLNFIKLLEQEKKQLSKEENEKIEKLLTGNNTHYEMLNKIRCSESKMRENLKKEFARLYDLNKLPEFYWKVLEINKSNLRSMLTMFKKITNANLQVFLSGLINNSKETRQQLKNYILKEDIRENDFHSSRIFVCIAESLMDYNADKNYDNEEDTIQEDFEIFEIFLKIGSNYVKNLYNESKFKLQWQFIENSRDKFFVLMNFVNEALSNNNEKLAIKYFRDAYRIYPSMIRFLRYYKNQNFSIDLINEE